MTREPHSPDQRRKRPRSRRPVVALLLAGYAALLGAVGSWPTPIERPIAGLLQRLNRAVPGSVRLLEFFGNIALFVPFGLLVALLLPRRHRWWTLLIGAGVSAVIEGCQALFLPGRVASIGDVAANTLGTLVGTLLVAGRTHPPD